VQPRNLDLAPAAGLGRTVSRRRLEPRGYVQAECVEGATRRRLDRRTT